MGKIIIEVQSSIDGYMADEQGRTDWMLWNWSAAWPWDNELQQYHNALTASADIILLSRKMAEEGFINHWASMAEQQYNPQAAFAKKITATPKVIFSRKLKQADWPNTVLATGDLVTEINKLKASVANSLIAYGGSEFISSLIQHNLPDEIHLVINPCVLGTGKAIFGNKKVNQFSLLDTRPYPCGIVVTRYGKRQ